MIKRFIVWYLKRHNVEIRYKGYVVRMFTKAYYDKVMENNTSWILLKTARPREKGGAE